VFQSVDYPGQHDPTEPDPDGVCGPPGQREPPANADQGNVLDEMDPQRHQCSAAYHGLEIPHSASNSFDEMPAKNPNTDPATPVMISMLSSCQAMKEMVIATTVPQTMDKKT
jgi:hypothetical protein